MDEIQQLRRELDAIRARNTKVEGDKAWEVSFSRKFIIAVLTYLVIVLFFYMSDLGQPFVNAIVPTMGFVLSTLSVGVFKKVWIRYFYRS